MSLNEIFLEKFTQELLENSIDPWEKQRIKEKRERLERLKIELKQLMEKEMVEKSNQENPIQRTQLQRTHDEKKIILRNNLPETVETQENEALEESSLGRIEQLVNNPSINSVECPGEGKPVIIRRGMRRIPTRIFLKKDEIENIINFFSENARIPRIGGVFKAIVNNLVINAIDSNFGGSKFIITKTSPQPSAYL